MKILGVDPGIHGGLAIVEIDDGAAPQLVEASTFRSSARRQRARRCRRHPRLDRSAPTVRRALIERAQAMPKQGASAVSSTAAPSAPSKRRSRCANSGDNRRAVGLETVLATPRQGQGRRAAASPAAVSGRACGTRAQERPRPRRGGVDRALRGQVMNAPLEPAHSPFGGSVAARVLALPGIRRPRREGARPSAQSPPPMPSAARRSTRRWRF